jgi:hypothetical protein
LGDSFGFGFAAVVFGRAPRGQFEGPGLKCFAFHGVEPNVCASKDASFVYRQAVMAAVSVSADVFVSFCFRVEDFCTPLANIFLPWRFMGVSAVRAALVVVLLGCVVLCV